MIELRLDNKTLYFGYGDICVGFDLFNLTFREFEPPIEVGTWFKDESEVNWLSERFSIPIIRYEEAQQLIKLLDSMDGKDNFKFDFKGWTFNFSNWNPKSVEVIKKYVSCIRSNLLLTLAC